MSKKRKNNNMRINFDKVRRAFNGKNAKLNKREVEHVINLWKKELDSAMKENNDQAHIDGCRANIKWYTNAVKMLSDEGVLVQPGF